ncbi:hypothetical protein Pla175_42330 [Pirellulimonas nuda]|uniref:Carboxypeptidase regulatory-like domain-containing protein n=1 Tax=Pirellulimonas nuda TaxID=2528009 RepID=A0A518DH68_9BACT|nr:carboxypeptidase regulatory-like domain-containing protein [Pirellulimonas nuda]QDU90820.1 hypothetical protein Pla175_42330 [Pirellulimonas nuda]
MTPSPMLRHALARTAPVVVALLAVGLSAGCSKPDFAVAPVAGTVTLGGEPLAGALVTFQPRASEGGILAGRPSVGETGPDGRYQLETYDGYEGAVVGTHRVSISTFRKKAAEGDSSSVVVIAEERVPARYNRQSELSVEVPSSGLGDCNFELSSNK